MSDSNGTPKPLASDTPFPLNVPLIERAALRRNVTKEQCIDYATRISYRMSQQAYEALNAKLMALEARLAALEPQ